LRGLDASTVFKMRDSVLEVRQKGEIEGGDFRMEILGGGSENSRDSKKQPGSVNTIAIRNISKYSLLVLCYTALTV
jgi:hypothetical protein